MILPNINNINTKIPQVTRALLLVVVSSILSFSIWIFYGSIPIKIHGSGIFLNNYNKIVTIPTTSEGIVPHFLVQPGENVETNQLIATLINPSLTHNQESIRRHLAIERSEIITRLTKLDQSITSITSQHNDDVISLENRINFLKQIATLQQKQALKLKQLLNVQQVSVQEYQTVITQYHTTLATLEQAKHELKQANINFHARLEELYSKRTQNIMLLSKIDIQNDHINESLQTLSIHSPFKGKVFETMISDGSWVQKGQPLLSLLTRTVDSESGAQYVIMFFPANTTSSIKEGMDVVIKLNSLKSHPGLGILGHIEEVSPFPISSLYKLSKLSNDTLIDTFSTDTAMKYALVILKQKDTKLLWNNHKQYPYTPFEGELVNVEVQLDNKTPIDIILSKL